MEERQMDPEKVPDLFPFPIPHKGLRGLARVSVIVHLRAPRLLAMARFVGYHGSHEQDDRNDLSERVYPTSR